MASYNGWPTYQTWLVFTWLTNEQDTYQLASEVAASAESTSQAGEALRFMVENGTDLLDSASLYADLLNSALCLVAWDVLARSFLRVTG